MMADGAGQNESDGSAARAEAVLALREALTWNLPARSWAQVHGAVEDIAAAASADPDTLRQATVLLALSGPRRVATRLGDTPQLPAPMAVHERIAELVGALTQDGASDADDAPDQDLTARM
jgi:CATRA-Associated Small Protein